MTDQVEADTKLACSKGEGGGGAITTNNVNEHK